MAQGFTDTNIVRAYQPPSVTEGTPTATQFMVHQCGASEPYASHAYNSQWVYRIPTALWVDSNSTAWPVDDGVYVGDSHYPKTIIELALQDTFGNTGYKSLVPNTDYVYYTYSGTSYIYIKPSRNPIVPPATADSACTPQTDFPYVKIAAFVIDTTSQSFSGSVWQPQTPLSIAASLDRIQRTAQRALERSDRAIQLHPADSGYGTFDGTKIHPDFTTLPPTSSRAGKVIGFGSDGKLSYFANASAGGVSDASPLTLVQRDSLGRAKFVESEGVIADYASNKYSPAGIWVSTKTYALYDVVNRNGALMRAVQAVPVSQDPALDTAQTYWAPVGVSAPTVNTTIARNNAGRAQVVDPSSAQDISTKGYTDNAGGVAASFVAGATIDNVTSFGFIYSGASGASPTGSESGTAATDALTVGTITSNFNTTAPILVGTKDFKLTKTAVLGAGWYNTFTLDSAYFGKVLQIKFPYWNTENDDVFQVFLRDVDNSNFIPLSDQYLKKSATPGVGTSANQFFATFFAPSITTNRAFRIYIHNVSNGAGGYIRIDNLIISDYITPNAAAVGGWTAYTPTFSAGLGAGVSSISFQYRRVGDSIDIKGSFNTGIVAASVASFTLPNGLTTTTRDGPFGKWRVNTGTAATTKSGTLYCSVNTNTITFTTDDYGPAVSPFVASPNATAIGLATTTATNVELNVVPIAQWTTNINLATDFTEYASNSDVTSTASVTGSGFLNGFGNFGTFGVGWAVGTSWIRRVKFQRPVQWGRDTLVLGLRVIIGGDTYDDAIRSVHISAPLRIGNTTYYGPQLAPVAGDPYSVDVTFSNGGRLSTGATYGSYGSAWSDFGTGWNWWVRKVSNGNMAEQPPVVRAEYTVSPTAAIVPTSVLTLLTGASSTVVKVEDTNSMVSTSGTITVTIPISGVYLFDLSFQATVASSTSGSFYVTLYKAASYYRTIFVSPIGNTIGCEGGGSTTMRCLAGDSITFAQKAANNTSGNFAAYRITSARIGS